MRRIRIFLILMIMNVCVNAQTFSLVSLNRAINVLTGIIVFYIFSTQIMGVLKRRCIYTAVVFLCLGFSGKAQNCRVENVDYLDNDLSASVNSRVDANGVKCALVKVQCPQKGIIFEGSVIGEVEQKAGEYWVYVSNGTKMLQIKHADFNPVFVKFSDYNIPNLMSAKTYCIRIHLKNNSVASKNIRPNPNSLRDSPYYSVKNIDKRLTIQEALNKCRTVILGDYSAFTLQKASDYYRDLYGSKYELYFFQPFKPMGSVMFPMNLTKFVREDNQYTISFNQLNEPLITLQITFNPENGKYSLTFINIDKEKYELTISSFQLSTQDLLWQTKESRKVFATTGENKLEYPYLFDILDYWRDKYSK